MRIISGIYKGKRLIAPKSLPVRPTTDFAKEGLFNILYHRVDFDAVSILDLFAGTGNISYEFASRGSQKVTCVDTDFGCVKYIQKVAEELAFPIQTIKLDVFKYLGGSSVTFDVIFADPPYSFSAEKLANMVRLIFENKLLKEFGMLIIEHSKHLDLTSVPHFKNARKYGGSVFSFFEE
jgi:16S rRNA (guanine(966)-N(2))-methyltransferase RsmD